MPNKPNKTRKPNKDITAKHYLTSKREPEHNNYRYCVQFFRDHILLFSTSPDYAMLIIRYLFGSFWFAIIAWTLSTMVG